MKNLFLSLFFFVSFPFALKAEWWSRVILFANDNGTWKVLLRHNPQASQWTDFSTKGQHGKKADRLAAQFLPEQITAYSLSQKDISPHWIKYRQIGYDADEYVHFVKVDFIPGSVLHVESITPLSDDFAWIKLDDFLGNQPLTKKKFNGGVETINVDPALRDILQKNQQKIQNILEGTQQPLQQVTLQPRAKVQGQGEWANIPGGIYFYDNTGPGSFYEFTNFYKNNVTINNKTWPTTEHYYQAMKFTFPYVQEKIRLLPEPRDAFNYARQNSTEVRQDWKNVNLQFMLRAVRKKFKQNAVLKNLLLNTGNKILVEDAKGNDNFFGAGANYDGANHLGQILMQVRDELRGEPKSNYQPQPASHYLQKAQQPCTPQRPQTPIQSIPQQDVSIENELSESLYKLQQALERLAFFLQPTDKRQSCLIQ